MNEKLFETGLAQREATLGTDYVEQNLAAADDFTRPFQEAMTAWCWGFGWGDETIDAKTRSMMNLAMIGGLGKMHEWEIHCRGAITNGVSKQEIRPLSIPSAFIAECPRHSSVFALRAKFWRKKACFRRIDNSVWCRASPKSIYCCGLRDGKGLNHTAHSAAQREG